MSAYLVEENFFRKFDDLAINQKEIFLQSIMESKKISSKNSALSNEILEIFTVLFEAYEALSTTLRKKFQIKMQANVNSASA